MLLIERDRGDRQIAVKLGALPPAPVEPPPGYLDQEEGEAVSKSSDPGRADISSSPIT